LAKQISLEKLHGSPLRERGKFPTVSPGSKNLSFPKKTPNLNTEQEDDNDYENDDNGERQIDGTKT